MLIRALKEITYADDSGDYLSNYLDALGFVDNLYYFIKDIQRLVPANKIAFRPTFKTKEEKMTYFEIQSGAFLGENNKYFNKIVGNTKLKVKYEISRDTDVISFLLKKG